MNWSVAAAAEVPAGVVTVMCTVPVPGGLVAVICVPESTVNCAAAPPKLTPVPAGGVVKPVPVMVTLAPPLVVPLAGETPVTETEDDDGGGVMVPVPLRAMSCGCREEPRSMRKSAVRDPGASGVNATVIVQVCACGTRRWQAGGCAAGWTAWLPRRAPVRVGVRIEKSCRLGPLMLTRVIVAGELPLLVMVTDLVMLALTRAAGKTRADGWKDTLAVGLPFGPLCPRLSTAPA